MSWHSDLIHTYSDGIHGQQLMIIGPLPPPLGGVSVHIQRVTHLLQHHNNRVFNFNNEHIYRWKWCRWVGFKFLAQGWLLIRMSLWCIHLRPSIIMYHMFYARKNLPELFILRLMHCLTRARLFVIDHDCRHLYTRSKRWKNIYCWFLQSVDQLILIGNLTEQSYRDTHIVLPKHMSVQAAFVPPDLSQETTLFQQYPRSLVAFLREHEPIILVNAFHLVLIDGKDLYGIDQSIALMSALISQWPAAGLIIMQSKTTAHSYEQKLAHLITTGGLTQSVLWCHGHYELWPLMRHVDLFIRPTLSDGASVSVQEALYLNTPVIASDVCTRPLGTVLYKTADHHDLIEKVTMTITQITTRNIYDKSEKQHYHLHTQ
jgi:glycosyltransferase involved in cell wall biosynthesis